MSYSLGVIHSEGAIQTQYSYEPFGKTSASGASSGNPSQYTGRENDGTGLHYYRARYYSPVLQRFISEDPIGFDGGDINLYAYVANDPLNLLDPLGLTVTFWESLIPVWGSGKQAYEDFKCGRLGWGLVNTAMAISDIFLVKSIATGLAKGAFKVAGSHTWSATSKWLTNTGWREFPGQNMHHWLLHQNEGLGKYVADWIKNQPWNLMSMTPAQHMWLHNEADLLDQLWHGTPQWAKAATASGLGRVANTAGRKD